MTTATASVFFALLSLLTLLAVVVVVAAMLVRRWQPDSVVAGWVDELSHGALWLGWLVATVTMLGSLYFSEVAHYTPCVLCWYQRIAMYPFSVVLLVAALRRDRQVWWYVLPVAVIGLGISIYHTQLQAFPTQESAFCSLTAPCTARYVWEFGFVSLPFMALTSFAFIITMVLLARTATDPADSWPAEDAVPPLTAAPASSSPTSSSPTSSSPTGASASKGPT